MTSPVMDQWSFTAPHEGIVPHLYLDTKGLLTCGVGFLVTDPHEFDRIWAHDLTQAKADREALKGQPAGKMPAFYGKFCKARLSEAQMRGFFEEHVVTFRKKIAAHWNLDALPHPVQIALVDMAFNLGAGGLAKYKQLLAAVQKRDWAAAAAASHRNGIGDRRNKAAHDLFMKG